ncbi:MAG: DUF6498-containing protein [Pseudomonadota bacterium]
MGGFFDPALFARTYRDPVALFGLAIDLLPLIAIFGFGWGLNELVIFYWMENVIIGLGVWLRLFTLATAARKGEAWFLMVFFPVHYGMFCAVHGVFLFSLFQPEFTALALFIAASLAWEGLLFARYFIADGAYKSQSPSGVMFSPYGRIVIVHLAIFAAAFSAEALGSPVLGAIAILVLDILWGIVLSLFRRLSAEKQAVTA